MFAWKVVLGALCFTCLASATLMPYGTIDGIALTGSGSGQFQQSSPQAGEIDFSFTLGNNEFIDGKVCVFSTGCGTSGGAFNPATPVLSVSFSVGCPQSACSPVSYNISTDWPITGTYSGMETTSGAFNSNDVAGMDSRDSLSFQEAIAGVGPALQTVNPTGGVSSYPFSFSSTVSPFATSGATTTANLSGSITVHGPEDTLQYSSAISLQSAPVPEPSAMVLMGAGLVALGMLRRRSSSLVRSSRCR
jgi:PEP-CTERM motif